VWTGTWHAKRIVALQGDITDQSVDAIVNAANPALSGGGGVDGAIHRKGGASILEECRRHGGCPTGSAVLTGAGALPARAVIHAVGPVWWGGGRGEEALLRGAYRTSLVLAEQSGFRVVAFPSISTGAYGYPIDLACPVAVDVVLEHLRGSTRIEEVRFVLFSAADLSVYRDELERRVAPQS
jgi:O-acetyl-ADP-ribose deacetylase (regulator of RNase III)